MFGPFHIGGIASRVQGVLLLPSLADIPAWSWASSATWKKDSIDCCPLSRWHLYSFWFIACSPCCKDRDCWVVLRRAFCLRYPARRWRASFLLAVVSSSGSDSPLSCMYIESNQLRDLSSTYFLRCYHDQSHMCISVPSILSCAFLSVSNASEESQQDCKRNRVF